MKTTDQYTTEIKEIVGIPSDQDQIEFSWQVNSLKEARFYAAKKRQIQKELRLVKREIGNDIKMLRADYRVRASNVEAGFWSTLAGRRAAGQDRARKKGDIKQEEIAAITPYEYLTRQIDKILVQLDSMKIEIERHLMEKD